MVVEKHGDWEEDLTFLDSNRVTKEAPSFAQGTSNSPIPVCFLGSAHTNLGILVSLEVNRTVSGISPRSRIWTEHLVALRGN